MTAPKTRPTNNFHCFEGLGRPWWQSIARGHRPTGVKQGPQGARIELQMEDDGCVVQNGGMVHPQEAKMRPGWYWRFFGTIDHNKYGAASMMSGGWWIDYETARTVVDWADRHGLTMAQAAQQLLVIPNEWQDCGYAGRAELAVTMKAWVGLGKPATGSLSPDNAARRGQGVALQAAPPATEIKQYFVPGSRALLGQVFRFDRAEQVIRHGARPPGL
jgi:hypothetical protein